MFFSLGSSKEKTSYKSPLSESSPIKKSAELNKRYETLKKIIQRELGDYSKSKQRSESLKIQKDEHDSLRPKSKKSSQDKDMNLSKSFKLSCILFWHLLSLVIVSHWFFKN